MRCPSSESFVGFACGSTPRRGLPHACLASLGIAADAWQYCIRHGLLGGPEVSARGVFAAELHVARPNRVERPIHVEPPRPLPALSAPACIDAFTTNTVPTLPTLSSLSLLSPIGQQRRQAAEQPADIGKLGKALFFVTLALALCHHASILCF